MTRLEHQTRGTIVVRTVAGVSKQDLARERRPTVRVSNFSPEKYRSAQWSMDWQVQGTPSESPLSAER